MLTPSNRKILGIIALLLFVPIALLQAKIDPQRAQYLPGSHTGQVASRLPIGFALGAVTGFREAIAGLLWVRTDEFFHSGDYEAITPMVRIITWLDPHQIDVYETGAWHMDYNFTDDGQRSDRRYIPLSIALLNEGIQNNPNVPDLYSDLAETHYFRKIEDFPKAAEVFEKGQALMDDMNRRAALAPNDEGLQDEAHAAGVTVTSIGHGLAHSYEAQGLVDKAIAQWQKCVVEHAAQAAKDPKDFGSRSGVEIAGKQMRALEMRRQWRARDTKIPVDMKFSAQVRRVAPKVFVVEGTLNSIGANHFVLETGQHDPWGPIDGCRIEFRLQDAGYKMHPITEFNLNTLNLDPNTTIMQDAASVRDGKFSRKIDMSKDPAIYSFAAPRYTFTFWFNPSNPNDCPLNVQDRIGWLGEGMTDKPQYLDLTGQVPGDTTTPIAGLRMLKKTITLTRDDLLGQGEKVFQ